MGTSVCSPGAKKGTDWPEHMLPFAIWRRGERLQPINPAEMSLFSPISLRYANATAIAPLQFSICPSTPPPTLLSSFGNPLLSPLSLPLPLPSRPLSFSLPPSISPPHPSPSLSFSFPLPLLLPLPPLSFPVKVDFSLLASNLVTNDLSVDTV